MPSEKVQSRIITAIHNHFKLELGRPEILNRIGENIVVFDYIDEKAAKDILHDRLVQMRQTLIEENGIEIDFSVVESEVYRLVLGNLENGGRGINNIIEKVLINPIGRHIFDDHVERGERRLIESVVADATPADIVWRKI